MIVYLPGVGRTAASRLGESLGREADFFTALLHDQTVTSFGRNDGCLFGVGRQATATVEIQAGRDRTRRMVVTLGILRCAQNDGKDL